MCRQRGHGEQIISYEALQKKINEYTKTGRHESGKLPKTCQPIAA